MSKRILQQLLALLTAVLILSASRARGDATVYWTYDDGFTPYSVTISPGESVIWWNIDYYYLSVTITIGGSLSFTLDPYDGGEVTFPYAGTYSVRSDWGDYGYVVVNARPSVTITNPLNGATFSAPASFDIQASATDSDGIANVAFYVDGNLVGVDTASPYSGPATALAEGDHALTAIATDNVGMTATNSITVTVTPPAATISLGNPRKVGNQFLFDVTGLTVGKTNVVQYCTNLAAGSWMAMATNTVTASSCTITNAAGAGVRFYRVYQLP